MKKIIRYFACLLIIWFSCSSGSPLAIDCCNENVNQSKSHLILHFKATVDGEPLKFRKNYINAFNESFAIEKFKFYFGKARLIDQTAHEEAPLGAEEYALIDFTDSNSCSLKLSFPVGKYKAIQFLLGVDSINNVSGAQTGALDPSKGMFWTWNSGYVMAKLEGSSPISNQPAHAIAYHIGGFRQPDNTARIINLFFPDKSNLEANASQTHEIFITADLKYWFNGKNPIRIKDIPTCTTPGKLARSISDNYSGMFSISRIIN